MKVLLLSRDEKHAFLLDQLTREGNEVALLSKYNTGVWDGLVNRVGSLGDALSWEPEVVLVDQPGLGPAAKRFREAGVPVVGSIPLASRIEKDYLFAINFLDAAGIPTCDYQEFTDVSDACEYVQCGAHPWRMVCSDCSSETFPDEVQLQIYLETLEANNKVPQRFALMRDFPGLADNQLQLSSEFWLCGFVNSRGLMNPCLGFRVSSGFLPGGMGIPTIEGVTIQNIPSGHRIIGMTLKKLVPSLSNMGYVGPVFLGCTVEAPSAETDWRSRLCCTNFSLTAPDGFWACFLRGLEISFSFFLDRLLNPRRPDNPYDFWVGHVSSRKLTVPPYPLTEARWLSQEQKRKLVQECLPPDPQITRQEPNIYWAGVRDDRQGGYEIIHPTVGYLTGKGATYLESLVEVRNQLQSSRIPFVQALVEPDPLWEMDLYPVSVLREEEEEDEDEDE